MCRQLEILKAIKTHDEMLVLLEELLKDKAKQLDFNSDISQEAADLFMEKAAAAREYAATRKPVMRDNPTPTKEKPLTAEETITTTKVVKTPEINLNHHLKNLNVQERKLYDAEKEKSNSNISTVRLMEKEKEVTAVKALLAKYQEEDSKMMDLVTDLRDSNEKLRARIRTLENKVKYQTQKMKNLANEFEV